MMVPMGNRFQDIRLPRTWLNQGGHGSEMLRVEEIASSGASLLARERLGNVGCGHQSGKCLRSPRTARAPGIAGMFRHADAMPVLTSNNFQRRHRADNHPQTLSAEVALLPSASSPARVVVDS